VPDSKKTHFYQETIMVSKIISRTSRKIALITILIGVVGIGISLFLDKTFHIQSVVAIVPIIICIPIVIVVNILAFRRTLANINQLTKK
jgi:hypothetical protein